MKNKYLKITVVLLLFCGISSAQMPISKEQYYKLNQTVYAIKELYVDTVNDTKLVEYAISGILENLDPHSVYIPAQEVQRANEGAAPRRARYNSSMMDSRELAKGAEFSALPETWVIFITENDIYGAGCPLCHVERAIEELQRPYDGGTHILYVNGANRDDTPLGRLMQDFSVSVRSR
mgnify:CR=1 FL=1